ncbi:uncharacterized protein PG998_000496 [Apiospora kogelbergensis]|uniref:Uncharacterized protein n=1 Tax=Apiospora kogelbergensis TaxID=1337665 RepID=A0AAW0QX56_9PEZI
MDSNMRGTSPTKTPAAALDSPEQLMDAFKTAALSVTKLYKTSAAAQTKARSDGYQDCLEDLLAFLEKQNIGLNDGEGRQIRLWVNERYEGRDGPSQSAESEDEVENMKPDAAPASDLHRSSSNANLPAPQQPQPQQQETRTNSAPPASASELINQKIAGNVHLPAPPAHFVVPTQDAFTFQSSMAYPSESDLNIANLDLSDNRSNDNTNHHPATQNFRPKSSRPGARPKAGHVTAKTTGKRKINLAELFDVGKDLFNGNGGGKRSRHT